MNYKRETIRLWREDGKIMTEVKHFRGTPSALSALLWCENDANCSVFVFKGFCWGEVWNGRSTLPMRLCVGQ